jgi:hypothetical protein
MCRSVCLLVVLSAVTLVLDGARHNVRFVLLNARLPR